MSMAKEALDEEACFPAGYRFSPTDQELIVFYLDGHPSPNPLSKAVHEIADFDSFAPWTLQDLFSLKRVHDCFFLTHRKCRGGKPKDNPRIGYWMSTGNDHAISIGDHVGGVHKTYSYYTSPEMKTEWMMQEYRIRELDHQDKKPRKEFRRVLCRIYKKGENTAQDCHRIDQALPALHQDAIEPAFHPNSFSHLNKFAYLDGYYHQLLANLGFTPSVNNHLSNPLEEPHLPLEFSPWKDPDLPSTSSSIHEHCVEELQMSPYLPSSSSSIQEHHVGELQRSPSPNIPLSDHLWFKEIRRIPSQHNDDRMRDSRGRSEGKDVQWSKLEEESLPIGVRFEPTDEEIISYFLMKQPCKQPKVIHEVDVYQYDPWTLQSMFPMSRVSDSYFITRLSRKYALGRRPKRTTSGGVWKTTAKDDRILDKWDNPVGGVCRPLVYMKGKGTKKVKTNWLMKEFRLGEPSEKKLNETDGNNLKEWNHVILDGVVLCKLYENKRIKQRNDTEEDELKIGNAEDNGGTFLRATPETHTSSLGSDDFSYQSLIMDLLE